MMSIMSFACSRAHGNVMCPDSEYKPCGLVRHGHVAPFVLDSLVHVVMSSRVIVLATGIALARHSAVTAAMVSSTTPADEV